MTLHHGDALAWLPLVAAESVDLIVTDPPYESLRKWEGIGTTARMGMGRKGSGADDAEKFFPTIRNDQLPDLMRELWRILKWNCHAYVMCDADTLPYFCQIAGKGWPCEPCIHHDDGAFVPWSNMKPLVWDKMTAGMGYHYRCRYEFVVMFDKGKNRKLNDLGIPDVIQFKRVDGKDRLVPTQKPLDLFKLLIAQSSSVGEVVCDPFLGAGTAAVASKELGRRFVGCELDAGHLAIAKRRLAAGLFDQTASAETNNV
ncbi:MAG: site-specific DNA-methyltransferase [Planctomycetes bacterium]|nr:site-specific DNA-methyltransferase [Planctomycetota bacterium]